MTGCGVNPTHCRTSGAFGLSPARAELVGVVPVEVRRLTTEDQVQSDYDGDERNRKDNARDAEDAVDLLSQHEHLSSGSSVPLGCRIE